jgi:hypothetical protein
MEQDLPERVFQVEDLVLAVKVHRPKLEDLHPYNTILEALDAVAAALVGVVDRGAEFLLQVFLVTLQATINLNTGHAKGIIQIRAKNICWRHFRFRILGNILPQIFN